MAFDNNLRTPGTIYIVATHAGAVLQGDQTAMARLRDAAQAAIDGDGEPLSSIIVIRELGDDLESEDCQIVRESGGLLQVRLGTDPLDEWAVMDDAMEDRGGEN
jgi:hypothetical protein